MENYDKDKKKNKFDLRKFIEFALENAKVKESTVSVKKKLSALAVLT